MLALLSRRGASFASALGPNALPALMRLAAKGLVRCDSFAPVRALLEGKEPEAPKQRARVRAKLSAAGRWEIARPAQEGELAARMETAFERWGILCRETARLEGIPWVEALARLRVQEYTGEVRRGYFVRALSGAQFVREAELPRVAAALESDGAIVRAVSACDPLLAWGLLVPPPEEAAFVRVPGNALVLVGARRAHRRAAGPPLARDRGKFPAGGRAGARLSGGPVVPAPQRPVRERSARLRRTRAGTSRVPP